MDKNCDNCIHSGRPSYEWPCTACTSAFGSAPSKWESIVAKDINVPSWIPVSDRLPDLELVEAKAEDMDLFPCLVVKSAPQVPKKRFVTKAWYDGGHFMDSDCIYITKYVTHWMELPEPPKEDAHE